MSMEDIEGALEAIRTAANDRDNALAHVREDNMMVRFIRYIATGRGSDPDLSQKAAFLLTSRGIKFTRGCTE